MAQVPKIALNNGVEIPQLGFGLYKVPPGETERAVTAALEAGYRHIDTAKLYDNEREVGAAIARSGVPREELFVTTKLWNSDHRDPQGAFDASLHRLGLEYVDLYLIHWPVPGADRYVDAWRALEKIAAGGRTRAIGVSNFQPAHLRRLLDETGTVPVVNQVELHPAFPQTELRAVHAEHGIATQAWAPLARGGVLRDERIVAVAAKHGRTPAQVVLCWHIQLGNIVFPKSVTPSRIRENIDVVGFELDTDDVALIDTLGPGSRIGPDPDTYATGA
jgi:2,5-diketo-D-gluconate reductase A